MIARARFRPPGIHVKGTVLSSLDAEQHQVEMKMITEGEYTGYIEIKDLLKKETTYLNKNLVTQFWPPIEEESKKKK